jgi:RNA polymerase sigma-70 factor (ECF subfamily)
MTTALQPGLLPAAGRKAVIRLSRPGEQKVEADGEVTRLLKAWSAGDRSVEERLLHLVLPDLRRLARLMMSKERREHTLQPSALLNEAYMRLLSARDQDWESRRHFFTIATLCMRRLLIDYARARTGWAKSRMEAVQPPAQDTGRLEQAILIDRLLCDLKNVHPDWCSVVELKYFMGFSDEETAEALGTSLRTVQRRFSDARRWLFQRLNTAKC